MRIEDDTHQAALVEAVTALEGISEPKGRGRVAGRPNADQTRELGPGAEGQDSTSASAPAAMANSGSTRMRSIRKQRRVIVTETWRLSDLRGALEIAQTASY